MIPHYISHDRASGELSFGCNPAVPDRGGRVGRIGLSAVVLQDLSDFWLTSRKRERYRVKHCRHTVTIQ
jgi:hypothetical protein